MRKPEPPEQADAAALAAVSTADSWADREVKLAAFPLDEVWAEVAEATPLWVEIPRI